MSRIIILFQYDFKLYFWKCCSKYLAIFILGWNCLNNKINKKLKFKVKLIN